MRKNGWRLALAGANILLIIFLDVFLFSPIAGPVSEASLASADRRFEGCRILDAAQPAVSQVLLVESREGEIGLAVLEKSPFAGRYHVSRDGFRVLRPGNGELQTAVGTMHDAFPLTVVDCERIYIGEDYEIGTEFRWWDFFRLYSSAFILLLEVEALLWALFARIASRRRGGG